MHIYLGKGKLFDRCLGKILIFMRISFSTNLSGLRHLTSKTYGIILLQTSCVHLLVYNHELLQKWFGEKKNRMYWGKKSRSYLEKRFYEI